IHQFLMGLNDVVYGTVCSQILGEETLCSFNQAYQRIIREEQHRNLRRAEE
ncbi:hypothetical protein M569_13244, partial [Genlisea aurea]